MPEVTKRKTRKQVNPENLLKISECVYVERNLPADRSIDIYVQIEKIDQSVPLLWASDLHVDSRYSDLEAIRRHFEEVRRRSGAILLGGDVFDAMQGRQDPRHSKSQIRPELLRDDYFDILVPWAIETLNLRNIPILAVMPGNHEASVLKKNETDLSGRLARELGCLRAAYTQFYRLFVMDARGTVKDRRFIIYATHGSGVNAPVTMGIIKTNRRQVAAEADIYLSGHLHQAWVAAQSIEYIKPNGAVGRRTVWHGQAGGYMKASLQGSGFYSQQEIRPSLCGAICIEIFLERRRNNKAYEPEVRLTIWPA